MPNIVICLITCECPFFFYVCRCFGDKYYTNLFSNIIEFIVAFSHYTFFQERHHDYNGVPLMEKKWGKNKTNLGKQVQNQLHLVLKLTD